MLIIHAIFRFFGLLLSPFIGRINWSPPSWLLALAARPIPTMLLVLIGAGSFGAWHWYQNLPQPYTVQAQVSQYAPNMGRATENPTPIALSFEPTSKSREDFHANQLGPEPSSWANLELLGKNLDERVEIRPDIPGNWRWANDTTLEFYPAQHWPANTEFTANLDESLFEPGIVVDDYNVSFTTPAFRAELENIRFYQDPEDSSVRKVVSTLNFNYPVDPKSLEKAIEFSMRADGDELDSKAQNYQFTVEYGNDNHTAWVHTKNIDIPKQINYMSLNVKSNVKTSQGGIQLTVDDQSLLDQGLALRGQTQIPDAESYFKVAKTWTSIVKDDQGNPDQILFLEFTDHVSPADLKQAVEIRTLLPSNRSSGRWHSAKEINQKSYTNSPPTQATLLPIDGETSNLYSYRIREDSSKQLLVSIAAGLRSSGEFQLANTWKQVLETPEYPQEISIVGEGALLSSQGARKLSVVSRGIDKYKVVLMRVIPNRINQLVTHTYGDISKPRFNYGDFDERDIASRWEITGDIDDADLRLAEYSAIDLGKELDETGSPIGLFIVEVSGTDERGSQLTDVDRRLVLITDLAIVAKKNADNSHDIFVQQLSTGKPVAGHSVQVIGRNGIAIASGKTDAEGHWKSDSLESFVRDQQPTAFIAHNGKDIAFLPYNRWERRLDFSRFDTGGINSRWEGGDKLRAYVFNDRGIYRPGEKVHIAAVVKRTDLSTIVGAPLEIRIQDARGREVLRERHNLDSTGFISSTLNTEASWATGLYNAQVMRKNGRYWEHLGSGSFQVEEFQPDTMKIRASFDPLPPAKGWLMADKLNAKVVLQNLFGAAAQDRRVTADLSLTPSHFSFSGEYKDFSFVDPYYIANSSRSGHRETLSEQRSDAEGKAQFEVDLSRFDPGTWRVGVDIQGYEAGDGRSVSTSIATLVSPAKFLVGTKPDGDLSYIRRDTERNISLVAVNNQLKPLAVDKLSIQLTQRFHVSALVRRDDGTMAYQSVRKQRLIWKKPFKLGLEVEQLALETAEAGDYVLEIMDADGNERLRAKIYYSVVGDANIDGELEKNTELQIKLDSKDYRPGDEIEMQIVAPYAGAGLITIEADKVYAWKWFNSETTGSMQTITVPDGMEGNAYVNVAFVRSVDSPEVFTSPLSYAVAGFSIDRSNRQIAVDLSAPERVRPGEKLEIEYKVSSPGKVVIIAVNEGILQVANYRTPQPLEHFLSKRALEVNTQQMLDLLLPEYNILREHAAAGGDMQMDMMAEMASRQSLNPFARKVTKPVAFWSGILPVEKEGKVSFEMPESFNGSLRIMAVVVSDTAIGVQRSKTLVRGDFVLTPNLVTAAAPGDEFDVTLGITNIWKGAGKAINIQVETSPSQQLRIIGETAPTITLDEGNEGKVSFRVKALDVLGAADIIFEAKASHPELGDAFARATATTSVRPAVPFSSDFIAEFSSKGTVSQAVPRALYSEFANNRLSASASPLVLADGLGSYLQNYPHACTEQIISQSFPALALLAYPSLMGDQDSKRKQVASLLAQLRTRQQPDGSFSLWPGYGGGASFASLYATHFLLDAKVFQEKGVLPKNDNLSRDALAYVKTVAANSSQGMNAAHQRAYAIYLLTRSGVVSTNYLVHLQEELESQYPKGEWKDDITAVYMAATYQLLQKTKYANELVDSYQMRERNFQDRSVYDSKLAHDAQYVYLLSRHFSTQFEDLDGNHIKGLLDPLYEGDYNTLSASFAITALTAYSERKVTSLENEDVTLQAFDADEQAIAVQLERIPFASMKFAVESATVRAVSSAPIYWQLSQAGYDSGLPTKVIRQGLEVTRQYLDKDGNEVTSAKRGDELTVRLRARSLEGWVNEVAIVDLLPAGFEVQRDSVRGGRWDEGYTDVREDRVVLYRNFDTTVKTYDYKVKVTAAGSFTIPPAYAEAMYDRALKARSLGGRFTVE